MLTITKIHSSSSQAKGRSAAAYLHYLGKPAGKERGFEAYARGGDDGPAPSWACKGPALLGLGAIAEAEQVDRLAQGLHPMTGQPLVKGAGRSHVAGLDLTFSAPKDVSAVFAGADAPTRDAIIEAMQGAARSALGFAEQAAVTRHGKGGLAKQVAQAAIAAMFQHHASRAGQPQLHVHALLFNVGKRAGVEEWSALEQRPQFEGGRKLATGALFRAELAHRLRGLGFGIEAAGPYFTIRGVTEHQRESLSARSREIDQKLREAGVDLGDSAARQAAALQTRRAKAEPPLPELLASFQSQAAALGITPDSVQAMREPSLQPELAAEPRPEPFAINRGAILSDLMASQSCATASEALALICQRAVGQWSASECLAELDAFMGSEGVVRLGRTEHLADVFTSKATQDLEREASERVEAGKADRSHRVARELVDREFDALEADLRDRLGVEVSLAQQRSAAMHLAVETGTHAFIEGWAGAGKTTLMRAAAKAWEAGGFSVQGCSQSAAASQNLTREAGIPSRTIASLLLALREERVKLTSKTILVLEESGTVGSREFSLLQEAVAAAGAKLACIGDPKQLQPIEAGGICGSLARIHGKAEISNIQRQRTDFEPLLAWLEGRARAGSPLDAGKAAALRSLPEDARLPALEAVCALDPKLSRAFERWRARFDFEWLREAVEMFARGEAKPALELLDTKGRLRLSPNREAALDALISEWAKDKTDIRRKAIVAATRAEVAELNARARAVLVERGDIADSLGVDVEIKRRDETTDIRRFAPGDRIVFTMNDRELGVANGVAGTVRAIERGLDGAEIVAELDDPNARGERIVRAPASFGWFDNALVSTAHRSQGRTFDSAHVLANASMSDREWIYVASSRSRFATTLHVDASALGLTNSEAHQGDEPKPAGREAVIDALAGRMRRSRAKGTTLDFEPAAIGRGAEAELDPEDDISRSSARTSGRSPMASLSVAAREVAGKFARRLRERLGRSLAPGMDRGGRPSEPARQVYRER
jgi:conjugative relaxase-like TrwC/TraI family protein